MTAKISEELKLALANQPPGQPLTLEDDDTQTQYVIMQMDVYQQMQQAIHHKQVGDASENELLKQAILNRRDESRQLNEAWEHVDAETWAQEPDSNP